MSPETPYARVTDFAFAVMGVSVGADGSKKPREACGTAFTIGGGVCLTAGHVWDRVRTFPTQGLGFTLGPEAQHSTLYQITEGEPFPDVDLAIVRTSIEFGRTFPWATDPVALLDQVRAFGYPYGFDPEREMLNIRGFQGEIIGGDRLTRLPGQPPVYELSFPCPRGLSGAPLILHDPKNPIKDQIIGVVLGNTITEMTVFSETERLTEGTQERLLIKTEAMHLGIAIRASEVLPLRSSLLGCTVREWLQRHGIPVTG